MSAFQAIALAGVGLLALFGRAYHYKMILGYWAWGRLRPGDADRLLPSDPRSAYRRGYREGEVAAREAIVGAIRERYCDTSNGILCSDFRKAADFIEAEFGDER